MFKNMSVAKSFEQRCLVYLKLRLVMLKLWQNTWKKKKQQQQQQQQQQKADFFFQAGYK